MNKAIQQSPKAGKAMQQFFAIIACSSLIFLGGKSWAQETHSFSFLNLDQEFGKPANSYLFSLNPALYHLSFTENFSYYSISANDKLNEFRREYDPKSEQNYDFLFKNYYVLNSKASFAASVAYQRDNKTGMARSLEKDFYEHYFAFTDTTRGDTKYEGPQLWFLYDRQLGKHLGFGIETDYKIERGLKDVYTRCETIVRDASLRTGLACYTKDHKTVVGLYGEYGSVQSKYEAVKELQDAIVKTFFGYHVFRTENPRSSNNKTDYTNRYSASAQLEKKDLFTPGLDLQIAFLASGRESTVEVGSTTTPQDRGYWVRNTNGIHSALSFYPQGKSYGLQLSHKLALLEDWARSGSYDILIIERDATSNNFGLSFFKSWSQKLSLQTGVSMEQITGNYAEYVIPFEYEEDRLNWGAFVEMEARINPILNLQFGASFAQQNPYFYWNTEQFSNAALYLGFDRLTEWGTLGVGLQYACWSPKDGDQNIQQAGLSIFYRR